MEHSEQIGDLIGALATARKKFKAVKRTAVNPYYQHKYAELSDYIDATSDGLAEAGLAVVHDPVYNPEEQSIVLTTIVAHASGQWMLNRLWVPVTKADVQGIGSAITYAKRYVYGAMLNVASQGEDDDGSAAVGTSQKDRRGEKSTDKDETKGRTINAAQLRALWSGFKSSGRTEEQFRGHLMTRYGIEHSKEILKRDLDDILKWLLEPSMNDLTEDLKDSVTIAEAREPGEDDQEIQSPPLEFDEGKKKKT